jgi:uncharacterized membrane protein
MFTQLFIAGIILLVLDGIFITLTSRIFKEQVASVQRVAIQPKYLGAIMCYMLMIAGLYYFILREKKSPLDAFFLGFIIYGIFESTNYVLFKNWALQTVAIDTLWGGVLMATTTFLFYKIMGKK